LLECKEERKSERDRFLTFYEKERLKDQTQASLIYRRRSDEHRDTDQMGDCSIKQEQNDRKIYLLFEGER